MRDVTALKKAEEVLNRSREELEDLVRRRTEESKKKDDLIRRSQKIEALGTLAGGIAHDFNNILATIIVNTELALLDADGPGRDSLPLILEAVQRGKDLVKQIITFSRHGEQERRPLRIAPVVREALKLIRASLPSSIEVREDIHESAGIVLADPSQIHQVVTNLCVNAGHAMQGRDGILNIALGAVEVDDLTAPENPELDPGTYAALTVTDTGCGMTPEIMDRVFDPFFTTKKPREGSGLGLSVVHGIVESYGGAITVSSELGRGSCFRILLPQATSSQEQYQAPSILSPGAGERILLVEDEAAQRERLAVLLGRLGYSVTARQDGSEALAAFETDPGDFDVIVTDQAMPKMSGYQLAEAVSRIRPGIPVVLCTGFSDTVDRERARTIGIREFVMKPFSLSDISATLRRVLAGSAGE